MNKDYGFMTYVIDEVNSKKYLNIFKKFYVNYTYYINSPLVIVTNDENYEEISKIIRNRKNASCVLLQQNKIKAQYLRENKKWFNLCRIYSNDLTPFNKTCLIDCDYFVFSNFLDKILKSFQNIKACYNNIFNNKNKKFFRSEELYMSIYGFHYFYGTILFWEKNEISEYFWKNIKTIYEETNEKKMINDNNVFKNNHVLRFDKILSLSLFLLSNNLKIPIEEFILPFEIYHYFQPYSIDNINKKFAMLNNKENKIKIFNDFHLLNKN